MEPAPARTAVRTIGRYALFDEIASGGMATVHLGRLMGPVGFSRTVAIKRLHAHFAKDPEFSAGFVDEARLAARIHHPNVVSIIDVLAVDGELSLVMDYVEGDSLAKLLRQSVALGEGVPLGVTSAILCGSLYGLHAAHEAVDEQGVPMNLVHRDVSPQNILVGIDGIPRLVDFGVAKAAQRLQTTAEGQVKGKVAYMAPEQIRQAEVHRTTDVYAMGVVLWETIAGRRLFQSDNPANLMSKVLDGPVDPPSAYRKECTAELDKLVLRALHRDPSERFSSAREFAAELQAIVPPAPPTDVGDWVNHLAIDGLTDRRRLRALVEKADVSETSGNGQAVAPEAFISSVSNEEMLTQAEQYRPLSADDSTQAVTGLTNREHFERSRIFLPLVLGLTVVAGGIFALLFFNGPELDTAPEIGGTPAAAPLPAPTVDKAEKPQEKSEPPEASLDQLDNEPAPTDEKTDSEAPAEQEEPAQLPQAAPPPVVKKAARPSGSTPKKTKSTNCPKFIVDAEGIRRINRKCWK